MQTFHIVKKITCQIQKEILLFPPIKNMFTVPHTETGHKAKALTSVQKCLSRV